MRKTILSISILSFLLTGCGGSSKAEDATKRYASSGLSDCTHEQTTKVGKGYIVKWYCHNQYVEYAVNSNYKVVGMKTYPSTP